LTTLDIPNQEVDFSLTSSKVQTGLEFLLSHFSEPLFPRKVSTATTRGKQYEIPDKDTALYYYKVALYEDCRIEAFGVNQTNPNLIFIDLDACNFRSRKALKTALTKTLKRIKEILNGHPTVNRSGRGYHIIQPIDCQVDLSQIAEFAELSEDPSTDFIRFAERYLSGNKQDKSHNPSMRSCLPRVPYTFNSKCKEAGIDAEVKILHKWDGFRPDYKLLIGHFYVDLVARNQQKQNIRYWKIKSSGIPADQGPIEWIEKLLQIPIDDFRKRSRDLIIVPYLVVRRGMTDVDQVHNIVMQWADKCAQLYRLEPTRYEYSNRIRSRIYEVMRDRIPPMRLETLREKNPDLYRQIYVPN
jgi:hypothetical protein